MASALNLSLLARGVGEVRQNGHEKVDVTLEPDDYYNFAESSSRVYLPPIKPQQSDGLPTGLHLPKTFITRKGALLLFSEDFAHKRRELGKKKAEHAPSFADLDLHTVDDLAKSILSYGSHNVGAINLHFVKDGRIPKRVRPGFSARRYLSKLTRSFDEKFLNNLLSKGYVSEKTLFQNNTVLPNLRKRINDDLSSMPAPYRIMKQMLMAPGILSGYSFFRQRTDQSDLSVLLEEEEPGELKVGGQGQVEGQPQEVLQIMQIKDGVPQAVIYSDLTRAEKENVLADLLVKSAISHALEKQKQILDAQLNSTRGPGEEFGLIINGQKSQRETNVSEFDMSEAVQSFISGQLSDQTQHGFPGETPRILAIRTIEALQRQVHISPKIRPPREPGGSVSDRATRREKAQTQERGKKDKFTKVPVLPPIEKGMKLVEIQMSDGTVKQAVMDAEGKTLYNIQGPTPQQTMLTDRPSRPHSAAQTPHHHTHDNISAQTPHQVDISQLMLAQGIDGGMASHRSTHQMPSFHGKALRGSGTTSVKDSEQGSAFSWGSRVLLPGGQYVEIGGSITDIKDFNNLQNFRHDGSSEQSYAPSESTVQEVSEGDLVHHLSHQARLIAAAILDDPQTGQDLTQDAKSAAQLWGDDTTRTSSGRLRLGRLLPHGPVPSDISEEYQDMVKASINSALAEAAGESAHLLPEDAEIDEQVMARARQGHLNMDDLEIVETDEGHQVVRMKSPLPDSISSSDKQETSRDTIRVPYGRSLASPDPVNRENGELSQGQRSKESKRAPPPSPSVESSHSGASPTKFQSASRLATSSQSGTKTSASGDRTTIKSQDSTVSKSNISTEGQKEEFVVGVVHDSSQLQRLYGPIEEPAPKAKGARKPSVPPAKPKKNRSRSKEKKTQKSGSTKERSPPRGKTKTEKNVKPKIEVEPPSSPVREETPTEDKPEEEEMEFIIIRDEFPESDDEQKADDQKSVRSVRSKKSKKSVVSKKSVTPELLSDTESENSLYEVSGKDARAAERDARANKRREEVEIKRREREEQIKRQKDEIEERERMQRQLEEERRQKEEERRMKREHEAEERRRQEDAEAERERRARLEADREKRIKEEYARKLELLKQQKLEEDRKRKELEAERLREEEVRRKAEEELMASMAEEERMEYEKRKAEEEELRRLELEERRRREAEEMLRLEAEARLMAEEMARKQAELERRLNFNRGMHLEAHGLDHCHNITEAFTWSYFELLQWLGLDLPDFERMRYEPHVK